MKPEFTTLNDQHPVFISDLLTKHNNNVIIHLKGEINSNIYVVKKYEEIEDLYCRNVNETYVFDEYVDALSFLNCETRTSLFCVLFNQSLGDNTRYHPLITNFNLSNETITFHLQTTYLVKHKPTSRTINSDFHYEENLFVTIISTTQNIILFNELLQTKIIPSEIMLTSKNFKNNPDFCRDEDLGNYQLRIEQENICKYLNLIQVHRYDIMVIIQGESHLSPSFTYYHNEVYRFENMSTFTEYMEQKKYHDYLFFVFDDEDNYEIEVTDENFVITFIKDDENSWSHDITVSVWFQDKSISNLLNVYFKSKS